MNYKCFIRARDKDGLLFCEYFTSVSKSRLHKLIDYYTHSFVLESFYVAPYDIQNPCPVGDKTDIKEAI